MLMKTPMKPSCFRTYREPILLRNVLSLSRHCAPPLSPFHFHDQWSDCGGAALRHFVCYLKGTGAGAGAGQLLSMTISARPYKTAS